jgi:hypothetical protein
MTDLRQLQEIEKLVEDSVFLPSPRHHLKQRVLKRAVEAKFQQTLWKRFGITTTAVSGTLVIVCVGFRLFGSAHPPTPTQNSTEAGPVSVRVYSPGHNAEPPAVERTATASDKSLGEQFYFHPAPPQSVDASQADRPAGESGQSNLSSTKDVPTNPQ